MVTAAVAVAGLGLSVYNTFKAQRDRRPRLKLDAAYGFLGYGAQLGNEMIILNIGNNGERPVTINSLTFRIPDRRTLVPRDLQRDCGLPCTLQPAAGATFWTEYKNIVEDLRREGYRGKIKVRLRAGDTLGNEYFGKTLTLDLS